MILGHAVNGYCRCQKPLKDFCCIFAPTVCLFEVHVFFRHTKDLFWPSPFKQHIFANTKQPHFQKNYSEVFIDPDYTRGGEAERCQKIMVDFWKHWRSATVVITYPIGHWMAESIGSILRKEDGLRCQWMVRSVVKNSHGDRGIVPKTWGWIGRVPNGFFMACKWGVILTTY